MANIDGLVLMDRQRIARSLKRMAYEIIEQNKNERPVLLFGIDERGFAVAGKLSELLSPISQPSVHRKKLLLKHNILQQAVEEPDIGNPYTVVVDDVIFSGETMFSALKTVTDHRAISEIHTAVLIDRGHRKFPIQAEFCGMELPTKLDEHVSVLVDDDKVEEVVLTNRQN